MRKEYDKLIRDRIPEIIRESGREYATEVMSDSEYRASLWEKLVEEAEEARDAAQVNPHNIVTELADLQEVMDAIMTAHEIVPDVVLEVQRKRRLERGGFAKRYYLYPTSKAFCML